MTLAPVWVPVLLLFMTSFTILSSFCSRCSIGNLDSPIGGFYGLLYLAVTYLTPGLPEEYIYAV